MRFFFALLLAGCVTGPAAAQVAAAPAPAPADSAATHLMLPGADCALFPAGARIPLSDLDESAYQPGMERFTPSAAQATQAERELPKVRLDHVSARPEPNDFYDDYPALIREHLKEFQRQYFGFYNKQHHACLFINFFIEKRDEVPGQPPYWLSHPVPMLVGGGWEYWSVYYDLNAHRFYRYEHGLDG